MTRNVKNCFSLFRIPIVAKHSLIILLIWLSQSKLLSIVVPSSLSYGTCFQCLSFQQMLITLSSIIDIFVFFFAELKTNFVSFDQVSKSLSSVSKFCSVTLRFFDLQSVYIAVSFLYCKH